VKNPSLNGYEADHHNATPVLKIYNEKSLLIPDLNLWLDHLTPKDYGFVSHAHADHFARHKKILCSPETAAIIKKRYSVPKSAIQSIDYNKPFELKGHRLELLPAGHITGSAMLHVTRLADDSTLLFTGDFKMRSSHTAKPIQLKQADHLVMETTFGKPHYVMPPTEQAIEQLINFVDNSLAEGSTPVLLAYSLGKAQEAHYLLGNNGISPVLHHSVAKMSGECIRIRVNLPDYKLLDELCPARHCIIMPPGARKTNFLSSVGKFKTAMLTGWSLDSPIPWRYHDVDELIPLSDHADYPDLIRCVEEVQPQQITTIHGFTKEFAAELRRLGYNAWSASGQDQLDML